MFFFLSFQNRRISKCLAAQRTGVPTEVHSSKMYRFPADPERAKLWLIKTPINSHWDQWEPNHNSKLCEAHFERNCFLTKATPAGIKKCLTKDAVPTLFSFKEPSRKRKLSKIRGSLQDIKIKPTTPSKVIHDHSYAYIYRSKVQHHSLYPATLSEEPPPPSENDPLDVSDLKLKGVTPYNNAV